MIKLIRFICILATLAISLLFIVLYFDQTLPETYYTNVNLWYSPIVSSIAFIVIFLRASSSPKGANSRKAYFGITLAVLFYFLGELTFAMQYLQLGDSMPYPSISDLFWAIGTVFFIDELFFMVSVINVHFTKKQLTVIYGITAFSVVAIILFIFGKVITASYSSDYTPFMKAMDLYYFTGDILILFGTIYVTFGLFSKTGFKLSLKHLSWIFLILGNFSMIFGDTFYSYFSLNGTDLVLHFGSFYSFTFLYTDFSIDNLLYMFQYMFWALCFAFFPAYLSRSFSTEDIDEEFIPLETKKNMNFEVPSVAEALNPETPVTTNTLTLSKETTPSENFNTEVDQ